MKRILLSTVGLTLMALSPALAQRKATIQNVPEIPFTAVPDFLKLPPGEYLGEAVAVATNSKGHVFVFHRSNFNRLFEFDQTGKFVKEIGSGFNGFEFAHSVRVDKRAHATRRDRPVGHGDDARLGREAARRQ